MSENHENLTPVTPPPADPAGGPDPVTATAPVAPPAPDETALDDDVPALVSLAENPDGDREGVARPPIMPATGPNAGVVIPTYERED